MPQSAEPDASGKKESTLSIVLIGTCLYYSFNIFNEHIFLKNPTILITLKGTIATLKSSRPLKRRQEFQKRTSSLPKRAAKITTFSNLTNYLIDFFPFCDFSHYLFNFVSYTLQRREYGIN